MAGVKDLIDEKSPDGAGYQDDDVKEKEWYLDLTDPKAEPCEYSLRELDVEKGEPIPLEAVPLPQREDPSEADKIERVAYLLQRLKKAGIIERVNQSAVARLFGVVPTTLQRDLNKYVYPRLKQTAGQRHIQDTDVTLRILLEEALDEGDIKEARKLIEYYNEWLSNRGIAEKEPDKVIAQHGVDEEDKEMLDELF